MEEEGGSPCRRYLCEYEEIPSERWFEPLGLSFSRYPSSTSLSRDNSITTVESSDASGDVNSKKKANWRMNLNLWGRRKKKPSKTSNMKITAEGSPDLDKFIVYPFFRELQRFSLKEVDTMTDDFSREMYEETDREVYHDNIEWRCFKGKTCSNMQVLVMTYEKEEAFLQELRAFSMFQHRNIARCVGWCHEDGQFAIVLEDMANGTLRSWIESEDKVLPWEARYQICLDLANAISYLHHQPAYPFPNRNITCSSIRLDSQFKAMLSSFSPTGYKRYRPPFIETDILSFEWGHFPPESVHGGHCHHEDVGSKTLDVFYLGIVIIEITCGIVVPISEHYSLADELPHLFRIDSRLEAADKRLGKKFNPEEMERLMVLGISCTQTLPKERPSIGQAIEVLTSKDSLPSLVKRCSLKLEGYWHYVALELCSGVVHVDLEKKISAKLNKHRIHCSASWHHWLAVEEELRDRKKEKISAKLKKHTDAPLLESCTNKLDDTEAAPDHDHLPAQSDEQNKSISPDLRVQSTSQSEDDPMSSTGAIQEEPSLFDIGIPTGYDHSGPLEEFQAQILKGYTSGLHRQLMMGAQLDEVLQTIRKITAGMVMLRFPLDEWNSVAQYVLRELGVIDAMKTEKGIEVRLQESSSTSSLQQEMDRCVADVDEDERELASLKEEHAMLANQVDDMQQKILELQVKIDDARSRLVSGEAAQRDIESRRILHAESLEKKRKEYDIRKLYESMFSMLLSFSPK